MTPIGDRPRRSTKRAGAADAEWLTDDQQTAWRALLQMTSMLNARLGRDLQSTSSLSLADYDVLVQLSEAVQLPVRVSDLARSLAWEQSRLSHQLARMEARGLVSRDVCASDRRGAHIGLTAGGADAIAQAAPAHVAAVRRLVFDALSDHDVRALEGISNAVLARVHADGAHREVATSESPIAVRQ